MLDIRLIRSSPDIIRADLLKRNETEKLVWIDDLLREDARSRELKIEDDILRQRRNPDWIQPLLWQKLQASP